MPKPTRPKIARTHQVDESGLYFDLYEDGSVRIIQTSGPHTSQGGGTVHKARLSPDQWAAASKAMSSPAPAKK